MSKQISLGLIGSGFAAETMLLAARLSHKCRVTAIFGGKNASNMAETYGLVCHDDISSLVSSSKIDGVIIATPHDSHYMYAKLSINNKKHVFCEKPFVTKHEEGRELIDLSNSNGVVLSVNHFQRNRTPNKVVREVIESGVIGNIVSIYDELVELPMNKTWQLQKGNIGFLLGYGVHSIDKTTWWADSKVNAIHSKCIFDKHGIERSSTSWMKLDSGVMVTAYCSDQKCNVDKSMPGKAEFRSRIVCEEGVIDVDSYGKAILFSNTETKILGELPGWEDFNSPNRLQAYQETLDNFTDSTLGTCNLLIKPEEALHNVDVCLAAYESNKNGDFICL